MLHPAANPNSCFYENNLSTRHTQPHHHHCSTARIMASAPPQQDKQSSSKRVAVVGAGVSGLAAAYKLKLKGLDVTVFESDGRTGGKLRSISQDGLIWDEGANTMTESEPEVGFLLDNLGLREKQQFPISQHKRYIAKNGTPVLLPSNPISLIGSNILSTHSKLQILLEPYLWKNKGSRSSNQNESVGGFFQRHFGEEVVDYLVDPFVAGTCGGDPESLSMRHTFPELWNLEERFGSIISGAVQSKLFSKKEKAAKKKDSAASLKPRRGSFSFLGGMQTLTDTLSKKLGKDELKLQSQVLQLSCSCSEGTSLDNWSITYASSQEGQLEEKPFDAVIVTAPLGNVKDISIVKRGSPFALDFIPEITYLPLSVVITTFKKENVKHSLEGFGVLIPSKEQRNGLKTLGTLFSSMMFPDRAPSDVHLYTTFVGGSRNRELAKASTDELRQIVTSDIKQLLGAKGEPTSINHYYWSKAFPLYGHNYDLVLEAIDKMERNLPGFFYAGNHKGGLSVGKSLASGCNAADLVISYLEYFSAEKRNEH